MGDKNKKPPTGGRVAVRRVQPIDVEYLQAVQGTLSEWRTAEDEEAYGKL